MSNLKSSTIPLRLRYLAIILGMVFFLWIPFEDTSEVPAILLAIAVCCWLATVFLVRIQKTSKVALHNFVIIGTFAGVAITPLTLVLMTLKTGLHGHSTPDFTPHQLISVIRRTPIWIISGFLIGLGSGIWVTNRQT
jgi:hypothetical protein